MSFSHYAKGSKEEVVEGVKAAPAHQMPESLKQYVLDGLASFVDGAVVDLSVYGHAKNPEGDSNPHNATIMLKGA